MNDNVINFPLQTLTMSKFMEAYDPDRIIMDEAMKGLEKTFGGKPPLFLMAVISEYQLLVLDYLEEHDPDKCSEMVRYLDEFGRSLSKAE